MVSLEISAKPLMKNVHQFCTIFFQKIREKRILPNSFSEVSVTPIPKLDNDSKPKKKTKL